MAEKGAYVFNVAPFASKAEVAAAVREVYKVAPRKVTLARIPRKQVLTRTGKGKVSGNRVGKTAGGKKAYVFLKSGDKIELA